MPRKSRISYADKFKVISPYVKFTYTKKFLASKRVTRKQKVKLTRYYNEVLRLKARPFQIYKSRSKEKVNKLQEYSGQDHNLKDFKVAFVPNGGIKGKISFKDNEPIITQGHIKTKMIHFNPVQCALDPEKYTRKKIKGVKAKNFNIIAGAFEIPSGESRESLPNRVAGLFKKYGIKTLSNGKRNWHYINDWFRGVRAIYARQQVSVRKFVFEKKRRIDLYKAENRLLRAKKRRGTKDEEIARLKAEIKKLKFKKRRG